MTLYRHAGLDPASTFLFLNLPKEGGPRIKFGVTEGAQ
jgi:hypothetical protein